MVLHSKLPVLWGNFGNWIFMLAPLATTIVTLHLSSRKTRLHWFSVITRAICGRFMVCNIFAERVSDTPVLWAPAPPQNRFVPCRGIVSIWCTFADDGSFAKPFFLCGFGGGWAHIEIANLRRGPFCVTRTMRYPHTHTAIAYNFPPEWTKSGCVVTFPRYLSLWRLPMSRLTRATTRRIHVMGEGLINRVRACLSTIFGAGTLRGLTRMRCAHWCDAIPIYLPPDEDDKCWGELGWWCTRACEHRTHLADEEESI